MENFTVIGEIGSGSFSRVYEAIDIRTKKSVAVKVLQKSKLSATSLKNIKREVEIMKSVSHPNVLTLQDVFENDTHVCMIMELFKGELFDQIVERGNYSEDDASSIVRQIVSGIHYLHSIGIAHRDLKPENLLIDETGDRVVICDFGLSKLFIGGELMSTACGTPGYVSPEVLKAGEEMIDGYGPETDNWAVGVITYILLCGHFPFYGMDAELYDNILSVNYSFPSPYWDGVSEEAKDFISKLLVEDSSTRITAAQCLDHPWLSHGLNRSQDLTKNKDVLLQYNHLRKSQLM